MTEVIRLGTYRLKDDNDDVLMSTSLLHCIQAKERKRSSTGVQFIFSMVEA